MKKIGYYLALTIILVGGLFGVWKLTSKPLETKPIDFTLTKNDRM